jgi:peptide deformylase
MAVKPIRQLGDPLLLVRCTPVESFNAASLRRTVRDLRDTLRDFKSTHGFGRGIAAPQIGVTERIIFIHVDEPVTLINPVITRKSRKMFLLWDDCFSFPDLLVKVRRHLQIEVRYRDIAGRKHILAAHGALSELLQHEIDHLDGILAIDRAIDSKHIVCRSEFERIVEADPRRAL